jgi:hypothetical protein
MLLLFSYKGSYNSSKEISMLSAPQGQINRFCLTAILVLTLPALGLSSTVGISVSGSVPTACGYGNCTAGALSADALTLGNSNPGSYNFDVTATDGDVYNVSGTFNNTFPSSTFLGFFPTVTLVSATAVGADTITLDMLQDFTYGNDSTSWAGTYNEELPFDLPLSGTTAAGQVLYSTDLDPTPQTVGLLGPVSGSGDYFLSANNSLSPLDGDLLIGDFQMTFTFPEGAPSGAYASSPIPEPSQTIPMAIAVVGLLLFRFRKVQSNRTN